MKVKLLRKVRKRFSIIKYTEVGNVDHFLYKERNELPLWVLFDKKEPLWMFNSYEGCYNFLVRKIYSCYPKTRKNKNRYNKTKSEKVWY